ncbi:MAG: MBL fold metallo-hydrolase [Myxococcota bacterium]|nr:MBL fold metallo-hydrolase [Myxococcota bacterium]
MRSLTSILGNSQRLDGGAMFGNAPKALWSRWISPDERNRIPLACRCLLVRETASGTASDDGEQGPDRVILFEAGVGAFFEPKLAERYGVIEPEHVLLRSLRAVGLGHEDIDVVVLSHLHFDHAGGLLSSWVEGEDPTLLFPNARFVVGAEAWERARAPHPRDRASFVPHLNALLDASGRLEAVSGETSAVLGGGYRFHRSEGHTPGLLLTEIATARGPVVFAADLIPGTPWVHLPITMGYDRYPERLIDEKTELLGELTDRGGFLFYTHDPDVALSAVERDERGRYRAAEPLEELVLWG